MAEHGFTMLTDKISSILKFSPTDRIIESKRYFRWITPIESNDKYILQYIIHESFFVDLVYCSKSTLPNDGYGLFAAIDLPKGMPIRIYLGRTVKINYPKRTYIMQFNRKYVECKYGDGK